MAAKISLLWQLTGAREKLITMSLFLGMLFSFGLSCWAWIYLPMPERLPAETIPDWITDLYCVIGAVVCIIVETTFSYRRRKKGYYYLLVMLAFVIAKAFFLSFIMIAFMPSPILMLIYGMSWIAVRVINDIKDNLLFLPFYLGENKKSKSDSGQYAQPITNLP